MRVTLKRSYGAGNQETAAAGAGKKENVIRKWGCGLIGLADLVQYLTERAAAGGPAGSGNAGRSDGPGKPDPAGESEDSAAETVALNGNAYLEYIRAFEEAYAGVYPRIGLNGLSMAAAFNRISEKKGWGLSASWGVREEELLPEIRRMLEEDLPVILSVGPAAFSRGERGVRFYSRTGRPGGQLVQDHYVTVTGLTETDGEAELDAVSWGRPYRFRMKDYLDYRKRQLPLLGAVSTNILRIRDRRRLRGENTEG